MITELGKELRKLRIDLGETLMDMSNRLNVSSAFLSAIETGRKRIPDDFLERLSEKYSEVERDRNKYEVLINQARREVRWVISGDKEEAEIATALARKFRTMDASARKKLKKFIDE